MEIRVEAGGRGGNTNEFLLPGVEREKVTGLEGGEENMGGRGGWFSNNLGRPLSGWGNTQVSILPDTIKAYHTGNKGSGATLEARMKELRQ